MRKGVTNDAMYCTVSIKVIMKKVKNYGCNQRKKC